MLGMDMEFIEEVNAAFLRLVFQIVHHWILAINVEETPW